VRRKKVRLDLMLGSLLKQRISIRWASPSHPYRACSSTSMASRVMPCSGFFGVAVTRVLSRTRTQPIALLNNGGLAGTGRQRLAILQFYLGAQQLEKARQPGWMSWPCRSRHQIAFGMRLIDRDIHVLATGQLHLRRAGGISTAPTSLQHTGGGQQLRTMTDRRNRLFRLVECAHQRQYLLVQSQILGRTAAGNHQRVVILGAYRGKIEIQRKVVPRLLAVGLVAFEIVNCGTHGVASLLL